MNTAWFEHGDALNCVIELEGNTRGFQRRVRRMEGVEVICTVFKPRKHGFARLEIARRIRQGDTWLVEPLESRWVWRGRRAPYYEFGATQVEIHGATLIDNREPARERDRGGEEHVHDWRAFYKRGVPGQLPDSMICNDCGVERPYRPDRRDTA